MKAENQFSVFEQLLLPPGITTSTRRILPITLLPTSQQFTMVSAVSRIYTASLNSTENKLHCTGNAPSGTPGVSVLSPSYTIASRTNKKLKVCTALKYVLVLSDIVNSAAVSPWLIGHCTTELWYQVKTVTLSPFKDRQQHELYLKIQLVPRSKYILSRL